MVQPEPHKLQDAMRALGALLEHRGHRFEVLVAGGSGLLLLGVLDRPTQDVDLVAIRTGKRWTKARPLPDQLRNAAEAVRGDLGLPVDWLDPGPTDLLDLGLPQGIHDRTERHDLGGLIVHAVSRFDQIHFKLYAAVDQGPDSKHAADLRLLDPTAAEWRAAADWCKTHDPSPAFSKQLEQALASFGLPQDDAGI